MISSDAEKKIENIIHGNVIEGQSDTLTTIRNHLCRSFATSRRIEKKFSEQSAIKEKQKEYLIGFINDNPLWHPAIPIDTYLTEGGEAKIYLDINHKAVLKVNDAIYYSTWLDFFNSLSLHNIFFPDTAYSLNGFIIDNSVLFAVLEQPYVVSDGITNIADINEFLEHNGFKHKRRFDYYNEQLGLLLEDIHDENVLTNNNALFFIDTVFYIHKTNE